MRKNTKISFRRIENKKLVFAVYLVLRLLVLLHHGLILHLLIVGVRLTVIVRLIGRGEVVSVCHLLIILSIKIVLRNQV